MEKVELDGQRIFLIRKFLSPETCEHLLKMSEDAGYEEATITTRNGPLMAKAVRNNDRLICDHPELAQTLWEMAQPFIPENYHDRRVLGFNERLRFYRYSPGQQFKPHFDGYFERDTGERSQLTFMIYLNDNFKGGETDFPDNHPPLTVTPEQGTALVFYHHQVHAGCEVTEGRKYVLRTDIMYSRLLKGSCEA